MKTELSLKRARELFSYDPATGRTTWRINYKKHQAGDDVGFPMSGTKAKRMRIKIDGGTYIVYRIAWLIHFGKWPDGMIDHIDGNEANNALSNMRDVSNTMNQWNRNVPAKTSRVGLIGVGQWDRGKYYAKIKVNKKRFYLGLFDTASEAREAYLKAKERLHLGAWSEDKYSQLRSHV